MIQKIIKIKSIGRFRNIIQKGEIFSEFTSIYAENGSGKTTFTSIIRSLSQNDIQLIKERKSTNYIESQVAEILLEVNTTKVNFKYDENDGWSNHNLCPPIEIFDIFFVNENIYSGFEFSSDHKKNLYKFVLGSQGVKLSKEIALNKEKRIELNARKVELETKISQSISPEAFRFSYDIAWFIRLKPIENNNIDNKINEASLENKNALNDKVIQAKNLYQLPPKLSNIVDLESLITDLQINLEVIGDSILDEIYKKQFEKVSKNNVPNPESWIENGFNYIQSEQSKNHIHSEIDCPFCNQPFHIELDIIKAYTQKFNTRYILYIDKLKNYKSDLFSFNIDSFATSWNGFISSFSEDKAFWDIHISTPKIEIEDFDFELFESLFKQVESVLTQKIQSPDKPVHFECVIELQKNIILHKQVISKLNSEIIEQNNIISGFKKGLKDSILTEKELHRLKLIRSRFKGEIINLCIEYSKVNTEIKSLETKHKDLADDEEKISEEFILKYANKINYYLKDVFRTLFQLKEIKHGRRKGQSKDAKIDYSLSFDDKEISFQENENLQAKYCLSEGDKNVIAFAFFLAKLDSDEDLKDKIIVFDDPLSSLDSNRRTYTVEEIVKYVGKVKQIIVLTHNDIFLNHIYYKVHLDKRKAFEIKQSHSDNSSSFIAFEIDEFFENTHFKDLRTLRTFIDNPSNDNKIDCLAKIRNVLEFTLKSRYHRQISKNITTFGSLLGEIDQKKIVFRNDNNRDESLRKLWRLNDISSQTHHGSPFPDYTKLGTNPESINTNELVNFIRDTFELIDTIL